MNLFADKHQRLRGNANFLLVLVIVFLGGCSSITSISDSTSEGATDTAIPSTVGLSVTSTPLPTAIPLTNTVLPAPEKIVKFQPFEISSGAPSDARPTGALVICGDPAMQLLRFVPEVKLETIPGIASATYCATSPDGKWLAYDQDSDESPTGSWLVVQSADGLQQIKMPRDLAWRNFGDYLWLDNQHLIFNNFINLPDIQRLQADPAYPMVVVNPFTGEHPEISSDYPGLTLSDGPVGAMSFNYSDVVYDPSLDLVIFPTRSGEHNYLVLWHRHSKAVLAKVEDQSRGFGHYPLWSPDAKQFAVPVVNAIQGHHMIEEWYGVSREGQVEQLTQFGDYFSDSDVGSASNWSPDGQKLAFWVDLAPSPCPGLRLAILETVTKQVTNTCLSGSLDYVSPPIWSLDSQYIIIRDASAPQMKTILVDLQNGQAFDITTLVGDSPPIGWLIAP